MAKKKSVTKNYEKKENNFKKIPVGVKIISILSYIGAIVGLFFGGFLIFGKDFIAQKIAEDPQFTASLTTQGVPSEQVSEIVATLPMLFITLGIVILIVSVLYFFVARGIWKGNNWARMLIVIFSVPGFLMSLVVVFSGDIINGLVGIGINGLVFWYLLFDREAKSYFRLR